MSGSTCRSLRGLGHGTPFPRFALLICIKQSDKLKLCILPHTDHFISRKNDDEKIKDVLIYELNSQGATLGLENACITRFRFCFILRTDILFEK